jgi:hypothetical protein
MSLNVPVAVGDVLEVRVVCAGNDSQAGENVLHYVCPVVVGGMVGIQDVVDFLAATLGSVYQPLLNQTAVFSGVAVRKVFPLPGSITVKSTASPLVGSGGTVPLPEQVSGICRKLTTLGGRHGRGRLYIPFPSVFASGALGLPTPAYLTGLGILAGVLAADQTVTVGINSVLLSPGLWNRKPPLVIGSFTLIQGVATEGGWATQRRRGFFGAKNAAF